MVFILFHYNNYLYLLLVVLKFYNNNYWKITIILSDHRWFGFGPEGIRDKYINSIMVFTDGIIIVAGNSNIQILYKKIKIMICYY